MKLSKIILINILILLFLISIIELFSGKTFNKAKLDCSYLLCNRNFKYVINFHEGLVNYKVNYKKDKYGFKDRTKNLENIDILTVGGSTTDQRYLKISDTWSKILEDQMKLYYKQDIDIVNAGIDGQSVIGHVWNLKNWFNKLENFSPKYIIFYIGINEALFKTPDEYAKVNLRQIDGIDYKKLNLFNKLKHKIKKNNGVIYKLYTLIFKKYFLEDDYNTTHMDERKYLDYIISTYEYNISDSSKKFFIKNLNLLYDETRKYNAIPIFITQKTLRSIKVNEKIFSINEFDYFSYEKQVSNIIINFCKKKKVYCIDANKNFNFEKKDTYDLVHLSPSGSKKLANYIFYNFRNYVKFDN